MYRIPAIASLLTRNSSPPSNNAIFRRTMTSIDGAEWKRLLGSHEENRSLDTSEDSIIQRTEAFVKDHLSGNDASHDFAHIQRVWRLARTIALREGIEDTESVELAALLHDIDDWKYSGNEFAGVEAARKFLSEQGEDNEKVEKVAQIIKGVGFKEELSGKTIEITPELACVQDADRLDAIGAIGIARCLTYGGHKQRPLYDENDPPNINMTKAEYMTKKGATINHFYEKLFKLKDMLKTKTGKELADERHRVMVDFVDQFLMEVRGEA